MTTIRDILRDASGAVRIADFGCVHEGLSGRADCAISLEIEASRGQYRIGIVVRTGNSSNSRTRVIKWPYSRRSAADLQAVLTDLRLLEQITAPGHLPDTRSWFGRQFDRLTGTEFLGEYRLESPLQDEAYGGRVDARLYRWREQREVSLIEGRSGHGFIMAQFPQAALTRMCEILEAYAREGSMQESPLG